MKTVVNKEEKDELPGLCPCKLCGIVPEIICCKILGRPGALWKVKHPENFSCPYWYFESTNMYRTKLEAINAWNEEKGE